MVFVCGNFVRSHLSVLPNLSFMYKCFKSLKDIYKDKCNLHVTVTFLEKLRGTKKGSSKGQTRRE